MASSTNPYFTSHSSVFECAPELFFQVVEANKLKSDGSEKKRRDAVERYLKKALEKLPSNPFDLSDSIDLICNQYKEYRPIADAILLGALGVHVTAETYEILSALMTQVSTSTGYAILTSSILGNEAGSAVAYLKNGNLDEAFNTIYKAIFKKTEKQQSELLSIYFEGFDEYIGSQKEKAIAIGLEIVKNMQLDILQIIANLHREPLDSYLALEGFMKTKPPLDTLELRRTFIELASQLAPAAQEILLDRLNLQESTFSTSSTALANKQGRVSHLGSFAAARLPRLVTVDTVEAKLSFTRP